MLFLLNSNCNIHVADIADDYIHISATLNSICAEDSTPNKK